MPCPLWRVFGVFVAIAFKQLLLPLRNPLHGALGAPLHSPWQCFFGNQSGARTSLRVHRLGWGSAQSAIDGHLAMVAPKGVRASHCAAGQSVVGRSQGLHPLDVAQAVIVPSSRVTLACLPSPQPQPPPEGSRRKSRARGLAVHGCGGVDGKAQSAAAPSLWTRRLPYGQPWGSGPKKYGLGTCQRLKGRGRTRISGSAAPLCGELQTARW